MLFLVCTFCKCYLLCNTVDAFNENKLEDVFIEIDEENDEQVIQVHIV